MFGCQPTNLYQYVFAKSKMVGVIVFLYFHFLFLFLFLLLLFFLTWSLADEKSSNRINKTKLLRKAKGKKSKSQLEP